MPRSCNRSKPVLGEAGDEDGVTTPYEYVFFDVPGKDRRVTSRRWASRVGEGERSSTYGAWREVKGRESVLTTTCGIPTVSEEYQV